jgi:hypothetical protein
VCISLNEEESELAFTVIPNTKVCKSSSEIPAHTGDRVRDRNSLFSSFPLVVFNAAASSECAADCERAFVARAVGVLAIGQISFLSASTSFPDEEKHHAESEWAFSSLLSALCWCGRIAKEQKPPSI